MTWVRIDPGLRGGSVEAPPSKSYTHRALVAGHWAGRPFRIDGPLVSDDTLATRRGIQALGSGTSSVDGSWLVRPRRRGARRSREVDCGESGTTLRFLLGAAAVRSEPCRFIGSRGLSHRPIRDLVRALRSAGARVELPRRASLPLRVEGPIASGTFEIDGAVSSQFVSSLLLSLPMLSGDSSVHVLGRLVSAPYLEATLALLGRLGIRVRRRANRLDVPGGQQYQGGGFRVPGDASSAAYLWAAGAVAGVPVRVTRVGRAWPQADLAILPLLREAGARVRGTADAVEVEGPVSEGIRVDLTDAPDLYPLAGAIAATLPGASTLLGASHAALKESDRRAATVRLARELGASATLSKGRVEIRGTRRLRPLRRGVFRDHRLVMSAAVASLVAPGPSRLADAGAVRKSYPGFWADLRRLGAHVRASR